MPTHTHTQKITSLPPKAATHPFQNQQAEKHSSHFLAFPTVKQFNDSQKQKPPGGCTAQHIVPQNRGTSFLTKNPASYTYIHIYYIGGGGFFLVNWEISGTQLWWNGGWEEGVLTLHCEKKIW